MSLETKKNSDLWQVSIICDSQNAPLLITVPKDCYTAELFEQLKKHPRAPKIDDFQLFSIGGTTRASLTCNMTERLSDYGIVHMSTLAMVARLPGGVWPTLAEVMGRPRHLQPGDGYAITTSRSQQPDILTLSCDGPRAVMRCGHAIEPQTLAIYCFHQLEDGKDEIRCPEPTCGMKWKFAIVRQAACLLPEEISEFEARAQRNFFRNHPREMNSCPRCGTFSSPRKEGDKRVVCVNCTSRAGKTFEFCWSCLHEWRTSGVERCGNPDCDGNKSLFDILASCPMKWINGVECPSKRACPKCATLIEHIDKCKHMTCTFCKYEFCFVCLKQYPCRSCTTAPRQPPGTKFQGADADGALNPPPMAGRDNGLRGYYLN